MFYGFDFIYNNIPSETYDLKIGFFNSSNPSESISGVERIIEEYKTKRNSKPKFFGTEISNKIEFDLTIYSESELDTYDRQAIDNWLFQNDYKFFSIVQEDYENIFFNCIITTSNKVTVGGKPYAKNIHVVCDDAYAYTNEYKYSFSSTSSPSSYSIENLGNINEYLYVEDMKITMSSSGTAKIVNDSDDSRTFEIDSLISGEILTVDNYNKILKSSKVDNRIGEFNKKWLRLIPAYNSLILTGNFNLELTMRYRVTI